MGAWGHFITAILLFAPSAFAQIPGLPDISAMTAGLSKAVVTTVALGLDNRSLSPATALGIAAGVEFGIDVALTQFPSSLLPAMQSAGLDTSALSTGIIPAPRFHFKKGISPAATIGFSGIYYRQILVYGIDFQYTLWEPEEGVTWAIRGSFNNADVLYVKSVCWTPQLVISRALDFADPYLGVGVQLGHGEVSGSVDVAPGVTQQVSNAATMQAFVAFMGTKFRPPNVGFQFTLEGGYSTIGMNWLSTRLGVSF